MAGATTGRRRKPHVVIAVANLPVERDRRVIRECLALESAGYRVSVICPRGTPGLRVVPGTANTRILAYPQPFAGGGLLTFGLEFAWSFLCVGARLTQAVLFQRARAAQACNPPDVFWPLALMMRAMRMPFVFDHHDLSPEVYESRGGNPRGLVARMLLALEWLSLRCASAVVSTNESYQQIAIERGGCRPDDVVVVRNGPALGEVAPRKPRTTDEHIIVYLGVLGPQDGVDAAIHAAAQLRELRSDWKLIVAGDGECLTDLKRLATTLRLDDVIEFTGWLGPIEVDELLASATIAVQPDPPTPHAERSTMAKTVEYLGRGLPVVAVDLIETRRSAADAAVYVSTGTPKELAAAMDDLLSNPARRNEMSQKGRSRFVEELAWEHQAARYIALWDRLLKRSGTERVPAPRPAPHDQAAPDRARAETS